MAHYDATYEPDLNKLPDPQVTCNIVGRPVPIQKVGIRNFHCPMRFIQRDDESITLETTMSMYVDLDQQSKGINMSRLPRTVQEHALTKQYKPITESITDILHDFRDRLNSKDAYLKARFSYPYIQKSLRSGLWGWQYYDCEIEGIMKGDDIKYYLTVNFEYSSACPCSFELAQQAIDEREVPSISHSQRSRARVTIQYDPANLFYIETLIDILRDALKTETQVMVKREDEQAFAELNGVYQKFVEDAARILFDALDDRSEIQDFVAVCEHYESLHSHNAVSVIYKGIEGGLR